MCAQWDDAESVSSGRLRLPRTELLEAAKWFIEDPARQASFNIIARSHGFKRDLDSARERLRAAIAEVNDERSELTQSAVAPVPLGPNDGGSTLDTEGGA